MKFLWRSVSVRSAGSLPTRGAWIEICTLILGENAYGNTSLPTRGAWIEIISTTKTAEVKVSLPTRGAWIEIISALCSCFGGESRSPHGERGLKSDYFKKVQIESGRSPHGERGLKCPEDGSPYHRFGRSPHGERGLKSVSGQAIGTNGTSLPTRGAWIEM